MSEAFLGESAQPLSTIIPDLDLNLNNSASSQTPPVWTREVFLLLVEDDEDDATLLAHYLRGRGVPLMMERVSSMPEFLAALRSPHWDLVICDHKLAGFDSSHVRQALANSGVNIPLILCSGKLDEAEVAAALSQGANDHVSKAQMDRLWPVFLRELRHSQLYQNLRQADERLFEASCFDEITHLPNHTLFHRILTRWLLGAPGQARVEAAVALVAVVDIDRFFRINASFGYDAGNDILCQVAQRLQERVGSRGVVARLNCDEFGLFLPGSHPSPEKTILAWMQIFQVPFQHGGLNLYLTPSVGLVNLPEDGVHPDAVLMHAETALQSVKLRGGNSVLRYDREMGARQLKRMALENDLRNAVEKNELQLYYQPCLDAVSLQVVCVEALVRWQHPRLGLLSPNEFISIADETGFIRELGRWVLNKACMQARELDTLEFSHIRLSVNVSAVQFSQMSLLQDVEEALKMSGLSPQKLILELTESVLMSEIELSSEILARLKQMQVKVSVDDFGTGYSSLSYLKRFPIDTLKIDRSFVREIGHGEEDEEIIRTILSLARCLRLTTVAEGVESQAQVDFLKKEGCDILQGFLFSRPLAWEDLIAYLTPGSEWAPPVGMDLHLDDVKEEACLQSSDFTEFFDKEA